MPRGGLLSRGRRAMPQMWRPEAAAAGMVRLEDRDLDQELKAIVCEARARYARHGDSQVNPSRAEIRGTLRRLAYVIHDDAMLPAVRILDSATTMHLRGIKRAALRDTSARGGPLIGGAERIRRLAQQALDEMPPDRGGKRAPKAVDLWFSRRLILYWNTRRRDKAKASKIPTPFIWFFQDAFLRAERAHGAHRKELDPLSLRRQITEALLYLKREGYTLPRV